MFETESLMFELRKQIQQDLSIMKQDIRDIKAQGLSTHHRLAALDSDKVRQDESNLYIQDRLEKIEKRLGINS